MYLVVIIIIILYMWKLRPLCYVHIEIQMLRLLGALAIHFRTYSLSLTEQKFESSKNGSSTWTISCNTLRCIYHSLDQEEKLKKPLPFMLMFKPMKKLRTQLLLIYSLQYNDLHSRDSRQLEILLVLEKATKKPFTKFEHWTTFLHTWSLSFQFNGTYFNPPVLQMKRLWLAKCLTQLSNWLFMDPKLWLVGSWHYNFAFASLWSQYWGHTHSGTSQSGIPSMKHGHRESWV